MPEVARAAPVSEATAYLVAERALVGIWPAPAAALEPVANSRDPVERIAFACVFLQRGVLAIQGVVHAMISAAITRSELTTGRPGIRFGLIDQALAPLEDTLARPQLRPALVDRGCRVAFQCRTCNTHVVGVQHRQRNVVPHTFHAHPRSTTTADLRLRAHS